MTATDCFPDVLVCYKQVKARVGTSQHRNESNDCQDGRHWHWQRYAIQKQEDGKRIEMRKLWQGDTIRKQEDAIQKKITSANELILMR
jgi:hypothetical protein